MDAHAKFSRVSFVVTAVAVTALFLSGCAMWDSMMGSTKLSGANESPSVTTSASGSTDIKVKDDRTVSGSVSVAGMKPTAAHIHEAPAGKNGPVIITLTKTADTAFAVPTNAKLTEAQYKSYKAGNLYVNVHSAAYPGGEVRAQLKP